MDKKLKKYLDDQHDLIFDKITELDNKIEPIAKIYKSFAGFGTVVGWVFTILIVPASVIVGIWFEVKRGLLR